MVLKYILHELEIKVRNILMKNRIDLFISCSNIDKKRAEWIASILEKEGYSTF